MQRRPLAQHRCIVGVDQERDKDPDIALIDTDAGQNAETAVTDDYNNAGERNGNAAGLAPCETIAEQHKSPYGDKQRPNGREQ